MTRLTAGVVVLVALIVDNMILNVCRAFGTRDWRKRRDP